jgi:hypothetical protein
MTRTLPESWKKGKGKPGRECPGRLQTTKWWMSETVQMSVEGIGDPGGLDVGDSP